MRLRRLFVVVIMVSFLAAPASAASPEQIKKSVDKAKEWLYKQQKPDGTWEYDLAKWHTGQVTGQTALVVYALLSSGESHQDQRINKAIDYIRKTDTTGVYALGMRMQIWSMIPLTPEIRAVASKDAKVLVQSMIRQGEGRGFYNYNPGGRAYSHSRAQYAVLGLWAAEQMGIDVPIDYWSIVEKSWIEHQDPSGGWNYTFEDKKNPVTAGMTAVGVASLFITQEFVHADSGVTCKGNIRNPAIDRGMKWLTDNFDKVASPTPYPRDFPFMTLYAVERIGVASGQKYFGTIDWYTKGADYLIKRQKSDGSMPLESFDIKCGSTSFAVLFLSRGSSPVVINKLDYSAATAGPAAAESAKPQAAKSDATKPDDEPHWNQRPRDAANAARWVGRQIERELNWQIVNLDSKVEDFHDAPILYLAGNQAITFTPEQQAKIKTFIEQGGMLLANADCNAAPFTSSVKALAAKMFPDYDFTPLPENHVIYTGQQFQREKWKRKVNVSSMNNGVRELVIVLADSDAGKFWQTQAATGRPELFELAGDIILYSVDKRGFLRRGETHLVKADEKIKPTTTIKIARIEYSGRWNPEPAGWNRLAAIMHNTNKTDLDVEMVKPEAGKLAGYEIAHMTGSSAFQLDPVARNELKSFVDKGGTLIIDAAGGSTVFATSVEAELRSIWPDAAAQINEVIPSDHPLFSAGGTKLTNFGYRNFARGKLGMMKGPQLRGLKIGDRFAVFYSREDLSGGLVGQSVDGIVGYDPPTASALMTRLILFANKK